MKTITRNIALTLTAIAAMATVGMASADTIKVTNSNVGYNQKILVCLPAKATNVNGKSISYSPPNAACRSGGIKIEKKASGNLGTFDTTTPPQGDNIATYYYSYAWYNGVSSKYNPGTKTLTVGKQTTSAPSN